jgi:TatD DNase family protein
MLDAHNHLHQLPDPDTRIREMRSVGLVGCVVNGTSESDWPAVAALADRHPDFVRPAFGLHPWYAHRRSSAWLGQLTGFLDRYPHASIGECGVDRWTNQPDLDTQLQAFLPQLRLARELNRPVTIHALKAWGPLLDALDREPPPSCGWLIHSYGGSPELVEQLVPCGAYFSFSGYFLHPRKARVLDAFRQVPDERLLLETDAPSMLPPATEITHPLAEAQNHPANLPAIATALASRLDQDPTALVHRCTLNTDRLFPAR